ncbi:hypothetical protein IFM89_012961 [Coptis chinensis]|uniref:Uncharacterized protein n=1 Tax=Coptis chinensis TaxID=261450 RepID=A0A835LRN6_9MAGN|nr:hypothetical protein IFM89_012961 [Coptis chinensis]
MALHRDVRYLDELALDTMMRMKLYARIRARFQGGSPYIYPLHGLASFLVLLHGSVAKQYGGTCYMLNKPEGKVEFDDEGKAPDRTCTSSLLVDSHNVAAKRKFIAFVSTEAGSIIPVELKQGIDLLGPVDEIFFDVYDRYEPRQWTLPGQLLYINEL